MHCPKIKVTPKGYPTVTQECTFVNTEKGHLIFLYTSAHPTHNQEAKNFLEKQMGLLFVKKLLLWEGITTLEWKLELNTEDQKC